MEDIHRLLEKLSRGDCSKGELQTIKRYLARRDTSWIDDRLITEWKLQMDEAISDDQAKKEVWDRLNNTIKQQKVSSPSMRDMTIRVLSVAAAIVLLVMAGNFFLDPYTITSELVNKVNDTSEPMEIFLEDNSEIVLLPGSKIEYESPFPDSLRKIILTGDARFAVARDVNRPFVVNAGGLETKVLGTVFSVSSRPEKDGAEVTLFEGKVEVRSKWADRDSMIVLIPGEQAKYHPSDRSFTKKKWVKDDGFKLEKKVIIFQRAEIEEVVEVLESWYGVRMEIEDRENISGTLVHRINTEKNNLENIINRINLVANYTIEKKSQNEFVVKSKK